MQFCFKSIYFSKYVLCFLLLSYSCQADPLDELFLRDPTLDGVVQLIVANGQYTVSTLISLKRRALCFYTSPVAYSAILNDGLKSADQSYKKATSDLLVETFPAFLASRPSPFLSRVLGLIRPNGSLAVSQLISLKRMTLEAFPSKNDYFLILEDGLVSENIDYRSAVTKLFLETFDNYLDKGPSVEEVVKTILPNGKLGCNALIALKAKALRAFPTYAAYASILGDGLRHSNLDYRTATAQLLSDQWESYLETKPPTQELLDLISYKKDEFHIPFFATTRDFILEEYKTLLERRPPISKVLAFIAPNGHYALDFLLTLKRMAFLYYTSHEDYLQIVGDGWNHSNERYRRACIQLEGLQTLKFLETNPSTSEVLKSLRYFSKLGIVNSPSQEAYEAYVNGVALDRLREDLQNYSSQSESPRSATSELAELSLTEGDSKSCPVCFGEEADAAVVELHPCHHRICSVCLTKYFQEKIAGSAYPILCPIFNCKTLCRKAELVEIELSEIERMKWERHGLHEEIRQIPGATFCSTADCPDAFIAPAADPLVPVKKQSIIKRIFKISSESIFDRLFSKPEIPDFHKTCRTCESTQCLKCGRSHVSLSCEDLVKLEKASEDVISKRVRRGVYKPCPKCRSIIEKNNGCDHMTCRKCKYEFYWSTLRSYP